MHDESSTSNLPELLEVGTITSPQGLKGEVRVYSESDFPERFTKAGRRWLQHPNTGVITEVSLQGGRAITGKNLYVIKLEGIDYRDRAEELRDYKLLVDKNIRPKLSKDEFHVADLVDLEVYHQETGENIGIVVDLYSAGNDLLEVRLHKQPEVETKPAKDLSQVSRRSKRKKYRAKVKQPRTIFIPFVKEIVPVVDLANQRVEISPPDGLLDIHERE